MLERSTSKVTRDSGENLGLAEKKSIYIDQSTFNDRLNDVITIDLHLLQLLVSERSG